MSAYLLEDLIVQAEVVLASMDPCPENHATAVALADAWRWQAARRAVLAAAGFAPHPQGLGWEEV